MLPGRKKKKSHGITLTVLYLIWISLSATCLILGHLLQHKPAIFSSRVHANAGLDQLIGFWQTTSKRLFSFHLLLNRQRWWWRNSGPRLHFIYFIILHSEPAFYLINVIYLFYLFFYLVFLRDQELKINSFGLNVHEQHSNEIAFGCYTVRKSD